MDIKGIAQIWQRRQSSPGHSVPCDVLLCRFLSTRDDEAFNELFRRHGKAVYIQCRAILRCEDLVHEAFQQTFTTLALKGHTIKHLPSVGGWLVTTARRKSLTLLRQQSIRQKVELALSAELADGLQIQIDNDSQTKADLFAALAELPNKYQSVLRLCFIHGSTHAQAARELHWPVGTVDTRVQKGLELLRKKLIRKGWPSGGVAVTLALASRLEAVPPEVIESTALAVREAVKCQGSWKSIVAGSWGVCLAFRGWMVSVALAFFGIGIGGMAYARWNNVEESDRSSHSLQTINKRLAKQELHQRNVQLFRSQVVPKIQAALQKLKLWNDPVKVVEVTNHELLLSCQFEQNARFGNSSKSWLTTRTIWNYNVINGNVFVTFDLKGDNQWKELSLEGPISIENPLTKTRIKFSLPALYEARDAFKILAEEEIDAGLEWVMSDAKLQSLRPYLGTWYIESDKKRKCQILVTEDRKPWYIDFDGRLSELHWIPEQSKWLWDGWGPLQLEEYGKLMKTGLGRWWGR